MNTRLIWMPLTALLLMMIIIVYKCDSADMYEDHIVGMIKFSSSNESDYRNFNTLVKYYCEGFNSIIYPYGRSNCSSYVTLNPDFIAINGILFMPAFLWNIGFIFWALHIDIKNRNYGRIFLLCIFSAFLILFIYCYIMHYQTGASSSVVIQNILSGSITYDDKMCKFDSNIKFKECYCQLFHLPHLNTTYQHKCNKVFNGNLVGLVSSSCIMSIIVGIYYLIYIGL